MRKLVIALPILFGVGCAHNGPRTPAADPNAIDVKAVVARMNQILDNNKWYYGIEDAKIVDNYIVAPPGTNRDPDYNTKSNPPGFEDCREAGINQFLLDLAQSGQAFTSFDADTSHRVYLPHVAPLKNDPSRDPSDPPQANHDGTVRTVLSGSGKVFSYLMNDTDDRTCSIHRREGEQSQALNRRDTEAQYLKTEIPKMSQAQKDQFIKSYKLKKDKSDAAIAGKAVGRLFETACHTHVVNTAMQKSLEFFRAQYKSEPVAVINLPASFNIPSPGFLKVEDVNVVMIDRSGKNALVTEATFDLAQTGKDECRDRTAPVVQVIPEPKRD